MEGGECEKYISACDDGVDSEQSLECVDVLARWEPVNMLLISIGSLLLEVSFGQRFWTRFAWRPR
eukprot:6876631-Pyramimonas_sp.AAC.1